MKEVTKIFVGLETTVREALETIQRGGVGLALIVDKQHRLIATLTDGDIRRAILNKATLDTKISKLLAQHLPSCPAPVVAPVATPHDKLLSLMKERDIRHVPLLNAQGKVTEVVWISEIIKEESELSITAVVMAGGKGKRLRPLTKHIPKPMLPLRSRPLMEHTIRQLYKCGIKKVHIATNYKSETIENHFGNGNKFGVDISYLNETRPLGTAGALSLLNFPKHTTLILNGDILTQLDFRAMYDFHRSHKAVMTAGVRKCDFKVPFGVITTSDVFITELIEKPLQTFLINAGIYLLEPVAYKYIPKDRRFDMPDLITRLLRKKQRVVSFPIQEYWLDIGHPVDYKKAKEDAENGKI